MRLNEWAIARCQGLLHDCRAPPSGRLQCNDCTPCKDKPSPIAGLLILLESGS